MVNSYELSKAFKKLVLTRDVNERIKLSDGSMLNDKEFAILGLIAYKPDITTAEINIHPYFANLSISTIKRFIDHLLNENLISATHGSVDKRERLLNVVEDK